jgi:hypothetical protein
VDADLNNNGIFDGQESELWNFDNILTDDPDDNPFSCDPDQAEVFNDELGRCVVDEFLCEEGVSGIYEDPDGDIDYQCTPCSMGIGGVSDFAELPSTWQPGTLAVAVTTRGQLITVDPDQPYKYCPRGGHLIPFSSIAENLGPIWGVAPLEQNWLVTSNQDGGSLLRVTPTGTVTTLAQGLGNDPHGIAVDRDGTILVATGGGQLLRVNPSTANVVPVVTGLPPLWDVVVGLSHYYVSADGNTGNLLRISPSGAVETLAIGAVEGMTLDQPRGLNIRSRFYDYGAGRTDEIDGLLVADWGNRRIVEISYQISLDQVYLNSNPSLRSRDELKPYALFDYLGNGGLIGDHDSDFLLRWSPPET